MPGKTGSKGIDEDIAVIALVEIHLATDSRHAEGIAIAADAGNNARDEVAGFGWSGSPKRSAFIAATGRAPMVNTSRKIPPTPVAAP